MPDGNFDPSYYEWPVEELQLQIGAFTSKEAFKRCAPIYWNAHVEFGKLLGEYIEIQASGEALSQLQKVTLSDKAKDGCRDLFANTLDNPETQLEMLRNWHRNVESFNVEFTMTQVIEEAKEQLQRQKKVAARRPKSDKGTANSGKSEKSTDGSANHPGGESDDETFKGSFSTRKCTSDWSVGGHSDDEADPGV